MSSKACHSAVVGLRLPDGSWRKLEVDNTMVFVSRDRTPKQRRLDMAGKRLLESITSVHPGIAKPQLALHKPIWRAQRQMQARLVYDAVPIVVITADLQEADVDVEWEPTQLQRLQLDKPRILQAFADRFSNSGVIDTSTWCK